jgi:hypothetical protein
MFKLKVPVGARLRCVVVEDEEMSCMNVLDVDETNVGKIL